MSRVGGVPMRAVMTFHHILSTKKIASLHAWAAELGVLGIIKVGHPGVLLLADGRVEHAGVREYVRRVKRLPWQTCQLRAMDAVPAPPALDALREVLAGAKSTRAPLLQLDRLKAIAPVLRCADARGTSPPRGDSAHPPARHAAAASGRDSPTWASFYSAAMRP
ncbi:hypothetical protein MSPP1_003808 [Malassezia sp. CBS 17886]|nr:hypothetical protein MSPP1_003808 [Malassezia sp. CBS 17886]